MVYQLIDEENNIYLHKVKNKSNDEINFDKE